MKIDIEEVEPEGLLGMNSLFISHRVHQFVIEVKYPEYLEIFYDLGFVCNIFDNGFPCQYPFLAPYCYLTTFTQLLNYYQSNPVSKAKKGYYDLHCLYSINATQIPIDLLKDQAVKAVQNMEYIDYNKHKFQLVQDRNTNLNVIPVYDETIQSTTVSFKTLFMLKNL